MIPTPLHQLGFDRPHLLVSLGDIVELTGPDAPTGFHVACLFDPLYAAKPAPGERRVLLHLPLTQALDLALGSVVHEDGMVVWDERVRPVRVRVDTRHARLARRQTLVEEGFLPPNFEVGAVPTVGEARWVLARSLDDDAWLAVPAHTVFVAYYAPNSKLAAEYLSGGIADILAGLRADPRNCLIDGVARLHFGRGRFVSDLRPLGRLLFDPVASSRADEFVNVGMDARRQGRPLSLECEFPFAGETTLSLKAAGWRRPSTGERVILGFNIDSCSHPFPFESIEAEFDAPSSGKTESDEEGGGGRGGGGRVFDDFDGAFVPLNPEAPVPAPQPPTIAALLRGTTFTSLPGSAVRVHRPIRNRKRRGGPGKRRATGTSPHAPSGDGDGQTRNVVTAAPGDAETADDAVDNERPGLGPAPAFAMVRHALEALQILDEVQCEAVKVADSLVEFDGLILNEVEPHSRSRTWARIRTGQQARCLLVTRLTKDAAQAAVFEILRNPGESFSTLAVAKPDRSSLRDAEIKAVYLKICKAEGLPTDQQLIKGTGLAVFRVRHTSADAMRGYLKDFLMAPPAVPQAVPDACSP